MKAIGKNIGISSATALLLVLGLSACGGTAIPGTGTTDSVESGLTSGGDDSSDDTSSDGDEVTDSGDEDSSSATEAYTWSVRMDGHDDVETLTDIYTDDLLQIEVTGLPASALSGTGYTVAYSCVRVQIEVEGQTQTAFVTNTGSDGTGACAGAVASQTLDFSSRMTSGHGEVEITVTDAEYDNCRITWPYYTVLMSGCPMSSVYSSSSGKHTVGLNLSVFVNGI